MKKRSHVRGPRIPMHPAALAGRAASALPSAPGVSAGSTVGQGGLPQTADAAAEPETGFSAGSGAPNIEEG